MLKALIVSGKDVTVFSRSSSAAVSPEGARVLRGDYGDQTFFRDGLKGIDALVLCVGTLIPATQVPFIDAAILAGVKWIIPSEFGTDSGNPEYAAEVPIIPPKVAVQEYLNEQVAKTQSKFMWTGIINGLILDWVSFQAPWNKQQFWTNRSSRFPVGYLALTPAAKRRFS